MKQGILLVLAVWLGVVLSGCQDPQDQSAGSKPPTAPDLDQTTVAAAVPWPPEAPADQEVQLADDLLAKNYYVVLDGSGSMKETGCSGKQSKAVVSKKALSEFAHAMPETANLGLLAFDRSGVSERVPLGNGPHNRRAFTAQVEATTADLNTPLRSAITLGYQKLEAQARRQLGYGEYHLVIVTDGEASSGEAPTEMVQKILDQTPVILHTIGFCIGEDHSLNQPGRIIYKAANNPGELRQGLQHVLAESPVFDIAAFTAQ